jgi:metallo-beta-lactamase family protein
MMEFGKDLKKLKKAKCPFIIISSIGMINCWKILKYFYKFAKHEKNTILLTGYQAEGTIGRDLLEGGRSIKLFGHTINVRANVDVLSSLSAHADKLEITNLIKNSNSTVKSVYLNHGEPESLISFQKYLTNELSTNVIIAKKNEEYVLKE